MRRLGCVIVLAIAIVGCGFASSPSRTSTRSTGAVLTSAVSKLQSTSAQTVHLTGSVTMGTFGSLKMSGDEQFSPAPALDMKLDLSGTSLPGATGTFETILVDNTIYENVGPSMAAMTGGKPWLKIDLKSVGSLAGMAGGMAPLSSLNQSADPSQQMKLLLTSPNVKRVGAQTVDGTPATHYAGDVDPARMAAATGQLTADQVSALKTALQQAGITTEHIDVWLGNDDLPVEFKVTGSSTTTGNLSVDMHFSNWGEPVNISAPPADQVADASQLNVPPRG